MSSQYASVVSDHNPERSGLPEAARGVFAAKSGLPSAPRGRPGVWVGGHWANRQVALRRTAIPKPALPEGIVDSWTSHGANSLRQQPGLPRDRYVILSNSPARYQDQH